MSRRGRIVSILLLISATSSCSDEIPANESLKEFPDPINMFDDSNQLRAQAAPPVAPPTAPPAQFAEFECGPNAPISTANLESEERSREEDGDTIVSTYYRADGATVFGLQAQALERFHSARGTSGVAAYVSDTRMAIEQAIRTRYPEATISGNRIESANMGGYISLEDSDMNNWTRIACRQRGQGGGR